MRNKINDRKIVSSGDAKRPVKHDVQDDGGITILFLLVAAAFGVFLAWALIYA